MEYLFFAVHDILVFRVTNGSGFIKYMAVAARNDMSAPAYAPATLHTTNRVPRWC